jgi:hypothetical protein
VTKRFKTPFGSSKSTVSLIRADEGGYDAGSGRVAVPVTLGFDQSLDVPVVDEDAELTVELSTDAPGGARLDASGHVALAGEGKFRGRGGMNPLEGKPCRIVISGTFDPRP